MICNQCPRKCNIDRGISMGVCHSPQEFRLARAALHHWEEPCISSSKGSGTVFFTGCNLGCVYCQNYQISHQDFGVAVTEDRLIEIFESLVSQGAHNINLVNPTHYATRLAEVLKKWQSPVPIVYNTSGYDSVNTLELLEGLVDIYLTDYKYSRDDKALRYSRAVDYPAVVREAMAEMRRQIPRDVIDDGVMKKGVIVRHLILPGNTNSAIEVIDYMADNMPDTYLSLMAQYVPCGNLKEYPEIDRPISLREYNKVVDYALSKGMEKLFLQELESADKKYIPPFDYTGVI
ncbi:MAG: radical SAM protein [Eubacterium sp.]